MRKFLISVNGKSYEVEVEEVAASANQSVMLPIKTMSPAVDVIKVVGPDTEKKEEPVISPAASVKDIPAGAAVIKAPMPGTILSVSVAVGETVTKGQILLILEAMKMENEMLAPRDGKIISIQIQKGSSVNPGDIIMAIE